MSTTSATARCPREAVAAVLSDGWLYASWVVGASRVRAVETSWPAEGARIHHSFGSWPALIDDTTSVVVSDLPRRLELQPRGWPLGEARVRLDLLETPDGCRIELSERAVRGPGSLVPQPVLDVPLEWRNRETLKRLVLLAEGGARPWTPAT